METSEDQILTALLTAVEEDDVSSIIKTWRGMTSVEQEAVVVRLLGLRKEKASQTTESAGADTEEFIFPQTGDETAIQADQTELIPKSVEVLQSLTGSDNDVDGAQRAPDMRIGSTEYWSHWRRRWKWSVLATAWAMATIYAFNGVFDSFGPMEWVVGIFGSVIFSGLLIGTLVNFAVALIPGPTPTSRGVN